MLTADADWQTRVSSFIFRTALFAVRFDTGPATIGSASGDPFCFTRTKTNQPLCLNISSPPLSGKIDSNNTQTTQAGDKTPGFDLYHLSLIRRSLVQVLTCLFSEGMSWLMWAVRTL